MADHGPVKIREGNLSDLIDLYQETYKSLVSEIVSATDAGKIQKAKLIARINYELGQLGVDVDAWVRQEMPQYYHDGANQAQQDLKALGVDISKPENWAVINAEAIKTLTDETALAFADSITTISRNAQGAVSDALKKQLNFIVAQGRLTGDARRIVSAAVVQELDSRGIGALIDARGRQWSFENYAEMLVRTKAVEARNQGLTNLMLSQGYDLVQVSNHNSSHLACHRWEGKILSLTGATAIGTEFPGGYVVTGTVDQAKRDGLFHPRCQHAINVIVPSVAAKTEAYDNPYNKLNWFDKSKADAAFRDRNSHLTTP